MRGRVARLALCLVLGVTLTAGAIASTWVNIGKNQYGSTYDVDWDSLRRDGDLVTFTLRVDYGQTAPARATGSDGYVAHRSANCADRSFADLQTDYMKDGAVKNSTGQEEKLTAPPGSISGSVLDKVCSR
jgi:hypothetical protein